MGYEWRHLAEDAMAANADPINGGIIDKVFGTEKWFVIPNNDDIPQAEGFTSKAQAFEYLEEKLADMVAFAPGL